MSCIYVVPIAYFFPLVQKFLDGKLGKRQQKTLFLSLTSSHFYFDRLLCDSVVAAADGSPASQPGAVGQPEGGDRGAAGGGGARAG